MRRAQSVPNPLLYAMLASSLGALLVWFGPPGIDLAAHLYQRALFMRHGFSLWDNFWYAGRYTYVTYSLLYYPLAAAVGLKLLATASVALAASAFGIAVEREWGASARWAAWAFAVALAASLLLAAFPYTLGLALALLSLVAVQAHRFKTFALLVIATFAVSPLAFVLLAVIAAAVFTRSRSFLARAGLPVICTGGLGAMLWRLFPGNGHFPFAFGELAVVVAFCATGLALTWHVERARLLSSVFAIYAAVCIVCYLVPSDIGANVVRLRFLAVPLAVLILGLRDWKPRVLALAVLVLAMVWNVTPLVSSFVRGTADPSASRSYWAPAIRFLHRHLSPSYRVEAVDTTGHWEATYLPDAGIPIVRGWFRQDDFPKNAILYRPRLDASAYLRWLDRMGARYVVLTDAPSDYSARSEVHLLRSGRSGLEVVFRTADITIFAVPTPRPILTGPDRPRIVAFHTSGVVIDLHRAGIYQLALSYTPYLSAPGVCVRRAHDGMIELTTRRTGLFRLTFTVDLGNTLAALTGTRAPCDPARRAGEGPGAEGRVGTLPPRSGRRQGTTEEARALSRGLLSIGRRPRASAM